MTQLAIIASPSLPLRPVNFHPLSLIQLTSRELSVAYYDRKMCDKVYVILSLGAAYSKS